jgi:hypothetical protein
LDRIPPPKDVNSAYLEPGERAAFNYHALFVLKRESIEVFGPVGSFWADPLKKKKEQSSNGEGLV